MRIAVEVRKNVQAADLADARLKEFTEMTKRITEQAGWWSAAGTEESPGVSAVPVILLRPDEDVPTLVILTPETAIAGIRALAALQGPTGEGVHLKVIAQDTQQADQVEGLLQGSRFRLEEPAVIDLEKTKNSLEWTIHDLTAVALESQLNPLTIHTEEDLLDLGVMLIPEPYQGAWEDWLVRLGLLETSS